MTIFAIVKYQISVHKQNVFDSSSNISYLIWTVIFKEWIKNEDENMSYVSQSYLKTRVYVCVYLNVCMCGVNDRVTVVGMWS